MLILLYGGSASGKSAYGEELSMSFEGKKYYLATMKNEGEESLERIKKHRKNREGRDFITVEKATDIGDAVNDSEGTVLLECLSNLAANEMFGGERRSSEELFQKIINDLDELRNKTGNLIIVSNNIFDDGVQYDEYTEEYLSLLGSLNIAIAQKASSVFEVVAGIPLKIR